MSNIIIPIDIELLLPYVLGFLDDSAYFMAYVGILFVYYLAYILVLRVKSGI